MRRKNLDIVLVDDEHQITELLEIFIMSASPDATIHSFNDPVKAKEFITAHNVDVLITDYKMPSINGIQLMEAAPSDTKKILISGYISEVAEDKLQQLNATFFEKPVPMKQLKVIIRDVEAHRVL